MSCGNLLKRLRSGAMLDKSEWAAFIDCDDEGFDEELFSAAAEIRDRVYGRKVFARGLVEFTSFCRNDCFYCGLRRSNKNAERYRLSENEIVETCRNGYETGFRTFVLQGGEDLHFTDDRMVSIIRAIKKNCPEAAVTISIGERSAESYRLMKEAGADRYLLRHETADHDHYSILHPSSMSLDKRISCLRTLKALGYQTGAGMMTGSPGSSALTLAEDMVFLQDLRPEMVGIGPFIPHHDTPFREMKRGSVALTLRMLALVRIALPRVLLPATTALGTAEEGGEIKGFNAGANVVMPNLTPVSVRKKYLLYDNKKITGAEAAENIDLIREKFRAAGYELSLSRGDAL